MNENIDKERSKKNVKLTKVILNQQNCLLHEVGLGDRMERKEDNETQGAVLIIRLKKAIDKNRNREN